MTRGGETSSTFCAPATTCRPQSGDGGSARRRCAGARRPRVVSKWGSTTPPSRFGLWARPRTLFFGRLVTVDGDPRAYFAMKPTMCEDVTAAEVVAAAVANGCEPEARIDLLHRSLVADAA